MNGLSEMDGYVVKIKLADNPSKSFYYKGTAMESGVTFALNTIVALSIDEAKVMDKEDAIKLCVRLNNEKEALFDKGYLEFEIERKF